MRYASTFVAVASRPPAVVLDVDIKLSCCAPDSGLGKRLLTDII
jgi:hypothetical protein